MISLCRDCLYLHNRLSERCEGCHSDRLVSHIELLDLSIAHIDCDAFYAAVEKRDNPEIRDKPVIVGGTGGRGVVTTACYLARKFGPRSAMPMFKAMKLCPDAVVIRPDLRKYREVSQQIRKIFDGITSEIQAVSLDEAYLDISPSVRRRDHSAVYLLAEAASQIESEVGITVSVGLSYNKFLAKLASDMNKPRGFSVIGRRGVQELLAPLSVRKIGGVGKVTARQLESHNINTIGDLQSMTEAELVSRFGNFGRRLSRLSKGEESGRVSNRPKSRSISNETTFRADTSERPQLVQTLERLCTRLADRLQQNNLAGGTLVLKLKTSNFQTITRNKKLPQPSQRGEILFQSALPLLEKECDGRAFRLMGIGVSQICSANEADLPDLFDLG